MSKLQTTFDSIEQSVQDLKIAHYKSMDGNKKAGKQARKTTGIIKKLMKDYKAESLLHDDEIDRKKGNKTRSEKKAEKLAAKGGKGATKKATKEATKEAPKKAAKKSKK